MDKTKTSEFWYGIPFVNIEFVRYVHTYTSWLTVRNTCSANEIVENLELSNDTASVSANQDGVFLVSTNQIEVWPPSSMNYVQQLMLMLYLLKLREFQENIISSFCHLVIQHFRLGNHDRRHGRQGAQVQIWPSHPRRFSQVRSEVRTFTPDSVTAEGNLL